MAKGESGRSQSAHSTGGVWTPESGVSKAALREGAQEGGCEMSKQTEIGPASVPEAAKQAGEVRDRWSWTEPSVWTDRMLTALEKGVKGGKWFSLIDKVYQMDNLYTAFSKVKANKGSAGVDHQSIEMFEAKLEDNLLRLQEELEKGKYRPRAIRRVWIPKPGGKEKRPLGIPAVRDRVVQASLRNVLEPIFERDFAEQSFGFRPRRGCKDALRQVDALLKAGHTTVVDADLKAFFDSIPKDRLLKQIEEKVADGRVLDLIGKFLDQVVLDGLDRWTPERGTPQGAIISPLLANIYLDPLDHLMAKHGCRMVRYADDFVILSHSREEAEWALSLVQTWVTDNGLALHPDKTGIVDANEPGGFDFLGYHFERGRRWPRKKSLRKIKETIRAKTKRANGYSLSMIISNINRSLTGWFEYYKHSSTRTFTIVDGWTRMRLRSILRARHGGRGQGRGYDHIRWPNAFFADKGLISLAAAHVTACQSAKR